MKKKKKERKRTEWDTNKVFSPIDSFDDHACCANMVVD